MTDPFRLEFVQRGTLEILVLALASGVIGTWIVLRGLAFFSHAVGTAAFPGLVLADGLAFPAHLGAAATAAGVAAGVGWLARRERSDYDSLTALVLVGALVSGVILASDVFHSGANVDSLLFGSLLIVDGSDVAWAVAAGVAVVGATRLLGSRWLATGFDPPEARSLGVRSALPDAVLLALVAFVAVAALSAVGALLATAVLVVPAATVRLLCDRMLPWQIATVALTAAEGVGGMWLAVKLNAPPGATIAVLSGSVFAVAALARSVRGRATVVALLGTALIAGCGAESSSVRSGGGQAAQGEPVKVVATSTQVGDFVRAVGGDAVHVTQILKPNTDPHEYEPRPADVQGTASAKIVFESGDNLDKWMADVVGKAGGDPAVVTLGDSAVSRLPGEPTGEEASKYDPHWWHDPTNVEAAIPAVRDALTKANPDAKASYARNADAYLAKLKTLDSGIKSCFSRVPAGKRKLVTDHDAFNYFAKRYGVTVIGAVIPSQTTQAQPSAGELAKLSAVIRREGVRAVFPESSVNPKLARAIAKQTGASADYTLFGDTLGPKGSDGATYLAMERHNADAMLRGFTGGSQGCEISGL